MADPCRYADLAHVTEAVNGVTISPELHPCHEPVEYTVLHRPVRAPGLIVDVLADLCAAHFILASLADEHVRHTRKPLPART